MPFTTRLTQEQRDSFCEKYLAARAAGMGIRKSYQDAVQESTANNELYPAWSTFQRWLRQQDQPEQHPEQAPEAQPEAQQQKQQQEQQPESAPDQQDGEELTEREMRYLDCLRAYRYRREEDIDALVARLCPEVSPVVGLMGREGQKSKHVF